MSDESKRPGRPPLYPHAASARLFVRVTPAQRLELRRVADAQGTGISGVIREMIDERMEDERIAGGLPIRRAED